MLNKTILAGRLAADPQIRYTQNESAVCRFRLAVKGYGKGMESISCVATGGIAKICGEYLKKGRLIAVEGKLEIRTYKNKPGKKVKTPELIVDNMQMLDPKFYNARK